LGYWDEYTQAISKLSVNRAASAKHYDQWIEDIQKECLQIKKDVADLTSEFHSTLQKQFCTEVQ
jgi:hypothetical protein